MSYTHPNRPDASALIAAVIFPAIVIVVELTGRFCAETFFDPMPTIGHAVLVSAVPIVNILLWRALQREHAAPIALIVMGGAAAGIAASYALQFMPMLPFALIAVIVVIGLLPFAPAVSLWFALCWTRRLATDRRTRRLAIAGGVGGVLLLALIDVPASITRIALDRYATDTGDRARSIALMRQFGSREALLRQAYGDNVRSAGVMAFVLSIRKGTLFGDAAPLTEAARELYYRVTGQAFNTAPRPTGRTRGFAWDEDRGGDAVGGRIADLSLGGSRIDGSVDERDGLAYLEWTLDLANHGPVAQEARFTLALPEGAVVSRATLWVNGEPREASIAGRGAVRAAYQNVVRASRDPLLVTTDGAQRVLVQAFPVQPGVPMRLRIGITAPFAIAADGARTLALPRIVERNFDSDHKLAHAVWIEGGKALRTRIDDATLLAGRERLRLPPITAPRTTAATLAAVRKAGPIAVEQRVARAMTGQGPLMLVVDTSADMAASLTALDHALAALAPGRVVGMVVAGEEQAVVAPAPWSTTQAKRIRDVLATTVANGGQDDRPALASALHAMPRADATILWLHGAQPVRFADPDAALEQALDRLPALPRLVRYQAVPGRALIVPGERWFDTARLPSPSGDATADLRALLASGPGWRVDREAASPGGPGGSTHLVRLWAAADLAGRGEASGKARGAAITLAHRLNIVTPVSGAVVLETDAEYKNGDLPVPDPDVVPTVPEPETWALLILAALAAFWLWRRQRLAVAA